VTDLPQSLVTLAKPDRPKQRSPLYFAWRRFASNRAALGAGIVLFALIVMAILHPDYRHRRKRAAPTSRPPPAKHWLASTISAAISSPIAWCPRPLGIGLPPSRLLIGLPPAPGGLLSRRRSTG
jgi:hypothetical protein